MCSVMHIHMSMKTHVYVGLDVDVDVDVYVRHMYVHMYVRVFARACVQVCICASVNLRMRACTFICACAWRCAHEAQGQCYEWSRVSMIPASVKRTLLRRRRHVGILAFKAPHEGLESSFCWNIARQRFVSKECFSQTPDHCRYTIETVYIYIYIYILHTMCKCTWNNWSLYVWLYIAIYLLYIKSYQTKEHVRGVEADRDQHPDQHHE